MTDEVSWSNQPALTISCSPVVKLLLQLLSGRRCYTRTFVLLIRLPDHVRLVCVDNAGARKYAFVDPDAGDVLAEKGIGSTQLQRAHTCVAGKHSQLCSLRTHARQMSELCQGPFQNGGLDGGTQQ